MHFWGKLGSKENFQSVLNWLNLAKKNPFSYHRKSKVCQRRNANVFFYAISTLKHGCHTDAAYSDLSGIFLSHNNHFSVQGNTLSSATDFY